MVDEKIKEEAAVTEQETPPTEEQGSPEVDASTIGRDNFLQATGFTSYAEAAKSMKEQHATITRLNQALAEKDEDLEAIQASYQALSQRASQLPQEEAGQGVGEVRTVEQIVDQQLARKNFEQVALSVRSENPKLYDTLYKGGYLDAAFKEKPFLYNQGKPGFDRAMKEATKKFKDDWKFMQTLTTGEGGDSTEEAMRKKVLQEQERAKGLTQLEGTARTGIPTNEATSAELEKQKQELIDKGDVQGLLRLKKAQLDPLFGVQSK